MWGVCGEFVLSLVAGVVACGGLPLARWRWCVRMTSTVDKAIVLAAGGRRRLAVTAVTATAVRRHQGSRVLRPFKTRSVRSRECLARDADPFPAFRQMPAPVDEDSPVADSEREADSSEGNSQSFGARNAVDGSLSTFWCSENARKLSQFTLRLTERCCVTSVDITWRNDRGKPYAPVKVEVSDPPRCTRCRGVGHA